MHVFIRSEKPGQKRVAAIAEDVVVRRNGGSSVSSEGRAMENTSIVCRARQSSYYVEKDSSVVANRLDIIRVITLPIDVSYVAAH